MYDRRTCKNDIVSYMASWMFNKELVATGCTYSISLYNYLQASPHHTALSVDQGGLHRLSLYTEEGHLQFIIENNSKLGRKCACT